MLDCKSKRWVQILAGERKIGETVMEFVNIYQINFILCSSMHLFVASVRINLLTALWQKWHFYSS